MHGKKFKIFALLKTELILNMKKNTEFTDEQQAVCFLQLLKLFYVEQKITQIQCVIQNITV